MRCAVCGPVRSRRAAALGCCGGALLACGALLYFFVQEAVRVRVVSAAVLDTRREWKNEYTGISHPYDAHAWHCANALAVLETGAKPNFEDVSVKLEYREENFDLEFYKSRKQFRYKSWSRYDAKDAANEALLATEVVSVNPVYLGAVAALGGSESAMFAKLSYSVVATAASAVEGVVAKIRMNSVPSYLNGVAAQLLESLPDLFPDVASVAQQWGNFGVVGEALAASSPALTTFEAASATFALDAATALRLLDASSEYALIADASYIAVWLPALADAPGTRVALRAVLGTDAANGVLAWLAALVDESNGFYLAAVVAGLGLSDEDAVEVTNAATWRALAALQFGHGSVTRASSGSDSILALETDAGIIVAPEFYAYTAASGAAISLSVAQATAFLDTFSDAALSSQLAAALRTGDATVFADAGFAAAGFTASNSAVYKAYLYTYLPESFFLKGFVVGYDRNWNTAETDPLGVRPGSLFLRADGTGRINSGLFTRRSLRDVLHGYEDALFDVVPAALPFPRKYDGLLGFQYDSIASQRADAASPLTYAQYSGKGDVRDVGRFALWRNATEMGRRPQVATKDGTRYDCANFRAQGFDMYPGGFESCDVWVGLVASSIGARAYRLPPRAGRRKFFFERRVVRDYAIWVTDLFRTLAFAYDGDVTVRGVSARRYSPKSSAFYTADCLREPSKCNVANAAFRMDKTPGFAVPMASAVGGAPSVLTLPALGRMEAEYVGGLFTGLPQYNDRDHGTHFDIEPVTGTFVRFRTRLQYAWSISTRSLDSGLWTNVYANTQEGQLYWPQLWYDDKSTLSKHRAKQLRAGIYDARIAAIFFAALAGLAGLVLVFAAFRAVTDDAEARPFAPSLAARCCPAPCWPFAPRRESQKRLVAKAGGSKRASARVQDIEFVYPIAMTGVS